ncbi:AbrB family transcriptional regulator [Bacillus taeanensis]|uniref:AbrB family transcriptional regulator n=1 Tax=Bacillus taeanensis TaxID=273032 RepID=A0A366XSU6_9BACI|nr:AbrB family transcriptional regulator [Bacillus taeanensis]RBW68628.1 hypothetical protein DS031_15860 [Bacillus taeanensis]
MKHNYHIFKTVESAVIGFTGAYLFSVLHFPLPWMLGPVTSILIWRLTTKRVLHWPFNFRQLALVCLGFMIGSSFHKEALRQILEQFPFMMGTTMLTVIFSLFIGSLMIKKSNIGVANGIFGSIPGGLSQIVVLSEETKEVDETIVIFMQTIRAIVVIFSVPFLIIHGIGENVHHTQLPHHDSHFIISWWHYALFIMVSLLGVYLGKVLKLPAGSLTGPLIMTAFVVVFIIPAPPLPDFIILISQLSLGVHIGLQLKPFMLNNVKSLGIYTIGGSLALVIFSLSLAFLLTIWIPMSLTTAFLSTAPGGIAEMVVTAKIVYADISVVSGYQLFRLFFIMFIVLPLLQYWIKKNKTKKQHNIYKT